MKDNKVKYRLKFVKDGRARFIGHLDLMTVFQRSIKRAKLPIAYSAGFNPHQEMSFALPLSLGYYGMGEYLDIALTEKTEGALITASLNACLPEGIKVSLAVPFEQGGKPSAASVRAACYEVRLTENTAVFKEDIINFISRDTIETLKKSKKNKVLTNIKPDILSIDLISEGTILMVLSAGPFRSLRADTVVEEIYKFADKEYNPYKVTYIRKELLMERDGNLVPIL